MTKFIKKLCLILALMMIPVGFAACKDKEDTDTSTPETPTTAPEITYSITEEVANNLIDSSVVLFEDAIDSINKSGILSDGVNPGTALTTPDLFDHVYNAKLFKDECPDKKVKLNNIYAFRLGGENKYNYFKVYNDENTKLYIDYINNDSYEYQYIGYEYFLTNNVIQKINVSYFYKESNSLNYSLFGNLYLDFENSCFEVYSGKVFEHTENFIKTKMNSENIESVTSWSYSYYEKYDFGTTKDYYCDFVASGCVQEVRDTIDALDIAKGYRLYKEYQDLADYEIGTQLNKQTNYIGNITNNFRAIYVYRDNKFEKSI